MRPYFEGIETIRHAGPDSTDPLAFRWYDADRVVGDRTMAEHLRMAVCYWHNFVWPGSDVFGEGTFGRPWHDESLEPMDAARHKLDVAFEFFTKLGTPFFCFHDRDVAPVGDTFRETCANLDEIVDEIGERMADTGVGLLWGTANLFGHPRYMAGAATSPDPEVFAHAAAQVCHVLDATHRLGGHNYVLWGGREGYETLLNTEMGLELDHMGRFLAMVVEYKHKIGFKGQILVEPKPQEPSKHQYDYDAATCFGFLQKYGLENEVKLNLEQGHAILAGHSFEHEIATASALGVLGSIDMNRNDYQSGWDTDQFPNNVPEVAMAYYHILKNGGLKAGGTNFDAKLRRQSLDAKDLIAAHIGGMDICARGLKAAAAMIEDGGLQTALNDRYAGWNTPEAQAMLQSDLASITQRVLDAQLSPVPKSGQQEILENYVNRFV